MHRHSLHDIEQSVQVLVLENDLRKMQEETLNTKLAAIRHAVEDFAKDNPILYEEMTNRIKWQSILDTIASEEPAYAADASKWESGELGRDEPFVAKEPALCKCGDPRQNCTCLAEPAPCAVHEIDFEAITWAYNKLRNFGVLDNNMENALMADRLNLMLSAAPALEEKQ